MGELSVALVHHPVYNKAGEVVTTSVTPLDLHDLARSCTTYGIKRCYIVNPLPMQRQVSRRIAAYWMSGSGAAYNKTRQEAFRRIAIVESLEEAEADIGTDGGERPLLIGTSAKPRPNARSYADVAEEIRTRQAEYLLLFGTGWGLTEDVLERCDAMLEPIYGCGPYNHLSVRGACAIILDRLRGRDNGRASREDSQQESKAAS